jgi:hypothetical protein
MVPRWLILSVVLLSTTTATAFVLPIKHNRKETFLSNGRSKGEQPLATQSNLDFNKTTSKRCQVGRKLKAISIRLGRSSKPVKRVLNNPDATKVVADSLSDFMATVGCTLISSIHPVSDPSVGDAVRYAMQGMLGNATTAAVEGKPTNLAKPKTIVIFVLRNAVVPAVCHQVARVLSDDLMHSHTVQTISHEAIHFLHSITNP